MLVHGLGERSSNQRGLWRHATLADALFTEHGWTVLDIPGFEDARIVVPVPGRAVGSRAWSLVEELEFTRAGGTSPGRRGRPARRLGRSVGDHHADELLSQLDDLQRARDESRAREATAQEVTTTLRASHEHVLAELGADPRRRRQTEG